MPDNISKLYGALKGTYELGSEADFRKYLSDGKNREALRKDLEAEYEVGDSASFTKYLGLDAKPQQASAQPTAQQKPTAVQQPKPASNPQPLQMPEGFGELDIQQAQRMGMGKGPVSWNEPGVINPTTGKKEPKQEVSAVKQIDRAIKGDKKAAKESGLSTAAKRMQEELAYSQATGKPLANIVNTPVTAPTAVQDESGQMLMGQTTDEQRVAQYQQQEKEIARKKIITPIVDDIQKQLEGKVPLYTSPIAGMPSGPVWMSTMNQTEQLRRMNEADSPEKLWGALNEYFGLGKKSDIDDEELRKQGKSVVLAHWDEKDNGEDFTSKFLVDNQDAIQQAAARLGMNTDDFVWKELIPNMSETIAERFNQNMSEKYSVKDTADYIAKRMINSSVGALARMGTMTPQQSQFMQEGLERSNRGEGQHFNAAWYDKALGEVAQFLPDSPLMMIGGAMGGAAAKGLGTMIARAGAEGLGRMVATGSPFLAANVGKLTKYGGLLGHAVTSGAANMGSFMGMSSMMQAMASTPVDDGYLSSIGMAGWEGLKEGAKIGTALGVLGTASGAGNGLWNTAKGRAAWAGGAFLAENQIFALSDYLADPEKFNWVDSSLDALYMQMAGKVQGMTSHGTEHIKNSWRQIFKPMPKMPTLTEPEKAQVQRAFGGLSFEQIAGDMGNLEKILSDKQNIPLTIRQKISGRVLGVFEPNRPYTYYTNIRGNEIYERAKDGELLNVHTFETPEERDAIMQEISDRKQHDQMTHDFITLDMKDQSAPILDAFAQEFGMTRQELWDMMQKKPVELIDDEYDLMQELGRRLHEAANQKGELHSEQSSTDGAELAGDSAEMNPDTAAAIGQEVAAAKEAYENFPLSEELRTVVYSLGDARLDDIYMYVRDNFSGPEVDNYLKVIADYANAKAKQQGYIDKMGMNIDDQVAQDVDEKSFHGLIDGLPDDENIITVTKDGEEFVLVNGNIGTSADGVTVNPDISADMIILRGQDGRFVPTKPDALMTISGREAKDAYADRVREQLQLEDTNTALATGLVQPVKPKPEGPAPQGEAMSIPEGEKTEVENAGGEAGDENVIGGNEPSATTLSRIPTLKDEQGADILDEEGDTQYQWEQAPLEDTLSALAEINRGDRQRVTDTVDAMQKAAEKEVKAAEKLTPKSSDPIKRVREQDSIDAQKAEAQKKLDYWTAAKDALEKANKPETELNVEPAENNDAGNSVPLQPKAASEKPKAKTADEKRAERVLQLKQQYGEHFDDDFSKAQTAEELASMYVGRNRTLSRESLAEELGYKLGLKTDEPWAETLLAKKGEGKTMWEVAHAAWESDENPTVDNEGTKMFSDQEIHDALITIFRDAKKKSDIMDYVIDRREEIARRNFEEAKRREAEAKEAGELEEVSLTDEEVARIERERPFGDPTEDDFPELPKSQQDKLVEEVGKILDPDVPASVIVIDGKRTSDKDWYEITSEAYGGVFPTEEEIAGLKEWMQREDGGYFFADKTGKLYLSDHVSIDKVKELYNEIKEAYERAKEEAALAATDSRTRETDERVDDTQREDRTDESREDAARLDASQGEGRPESDGRVDAEAVPQPTEKDEYLKPRNEKEKQIVSDVEAKLAEEIKAAEEEVKKAKSAYEKARTKESDRATDIFSDDKAFEKPDQLFSFDEMGGTDRSQEGVNRRTEEVRERLIDAQAKLDKLQSKAEHDSRVRGALDNERRQTSIDGFDARKKEEYDKYIKPLLGRSDEELRQMAKKKEDAVNGDLNQLAGDKEYSAIQNVLLQREYDRLRDDAKNFIQNTIDDGDVTFVDKLTLMEFDKLHRLIDEQGVDDPGGKIENYVKSLRKKYPVGETKPQPAEKGAFVPSAKTARLDERAQVETDKLYDLEQERDKLIEEREQLESSLKGKRGAKREEIENSIKEVRKKIRELNDKIDEQEDKTNDAVEEWRDSERKEMMEHFGKMSDQEILRLAKEKEDAAGSDDDALYGDPEYMAIIDILEERGLESPKYSDNPIEAIEKAAQEFKEEKKQEQKELGIITDETPEQKADRERAEKLADTPLTNEEVDSSSASDVQKTLAKAYLDGNHGILQEAAYLNVYNDVRNRRQDNEANRSDADGTQLASPNDREERGSGQPGESTESVAVGGDVPAQGDGRAESGGVQRVEDSTVNVPASAGKRSGSGVSESESKVDGLSAGNEQPVGGSGVGSQGRDVRSTGASQRGSGVAGQAGERENKARQVNSPKPAAGSDAAIEASKQRLAELRKKFKDAGKKDLSISLVGMNNEQIEILGEIITESANLGYQYINRGLRDFNEWRKQMLSDFKDWLQEDFHWTDADVEEYLREVWNCEYNIDGVTRTIGEWSSFIGENELKKVVKADRGTKFEQQKAAESVETKVGDIDNIRESLPFLLPEQQDDVYKAETQFFDETHQDREHGNGKGMMFTNGTGTGKTYTGLGIVKRFVKQGKGRVLILTPSQEKVSDWRKDGLNLGLDIESLDEEAKTKGTSATKAKGTGVVVTTYANARQNLAMLEDCFDLIVYDESHKIMESKEATNTTMMDFHEMLTNKNVERSMDRQTYWLPEWIEYRNLQKERDVNRERLDALDDYADNETVKVDGKEYVVGELKAKLNARMVEIEKRFEELRPIMQEIRESKRPQAEIDSKRTKTVFLSATPFNVRESLRYAEGYLFSFPEEDKNTIGSYNHRSPEDAFLEQMFPAGYRWRYGRLESHVSNAEALGRQEIDFSDYLQNTLQTMSGRMISSDYDYSRDFPVMTLDHAGRFNQAMSEVYKNKRYQPLAEAFRKCFDYNYSTALFEAMKTSLVNERIKEHLKRGQKVVVFHRRRTSGDLEPPFRRALDYAALQASQEPDQQRKANIRSAIAAFEHDFADMLEWEQTLDYTLPREQIEKVFGKDKVAFFSGAESKKTKHQSVEEFMKDNGGKDIIVIQEASGKEGISLHDQTGKHQRVEINLALPQSPIAFIQIEGRIYRIGQKSNAIFEYPLLGLDLETNLFAQKFNGALGTTENLALGSKARNLRKSIANSVLENTGEVDYERQGLGGKDMDGRVDEAGDKDGFDVSIQDYYGNQKMKRGRDDREGVDYFPTPEPIGYKMVEWGQLMEGETALEPSAGHGAIARYVPETNGMTAIEPSSSLFTKLQMRAGGPGRRFEEIPFEDYPLGNKHDVVLMNPPYGVQGKTAMEHVAKAFKHLNEGGRLIAIIPDGPAMDKRLDSWLASRSNGVHYGVDGSAVVTGEVKLPSIAFGRAGTNVRTRVVVIDKISRAQMREKAPQKVTYDLSNEESIGGLFDRIRDVRMPERTIDQVAINTKKALRTKRQLEENPFCTNFSIETNSLGSYLVVSNSSRFGLSQIRLNLSNPDMSDVLRCYKDYKKTMENPEGLEGGKFAKKTYGRGKEKVSGAEAVKDFCQQAIKTLENVTGVTADQMDKMIREQEAERERKRQEQEAEYQRLKEEQARQREEKIQKVVAVALEENKDNPTLTAAGIENNIRIAHGNNWDMSFRASRLLRDAGIDWQTGHKINKNEPVNARTSTVATPTSNAAGTVARPRKADYQYKLDKHTRTGADMHLVSYNGARLSDADYRATERKAKALDGYYNRVKRAFHFKTEADARKFAEEMNGTIREEGTTTRFRLREKEAPKKTQKVYKLMRLGDDGKLYPLFIDAAAPTELGKWYDADSPDVKNLEGLEPGFAYKVDKEGNVVETKPVNRTKTTITGLPNVQKINDATNEESRWITVTTDKKGAKTYHNVGINGSGQPGTFAMRPGWHAGSLPSMRQIGKGKDRNLRDDKFVWVEGEVPADVDYQEEANGNPFKDIPTHIPEDGYYMKATNANKEASQADRIGWYVAGAFKPNRIMSDREARKAIDDWNEEHPDQQVEYDFERESGKEFNAETMQLEDKPTTRFRFAKDKDDFDRIREEAVKSKGIVVKGLGDAEVKVTSVPKHDFTGTGKQAIKSAKEWAKKNLIGEHKGTDSSGEEFVYHIDNDAIGKYLSKSSTGNSDNLGVHLAVLKELPSVIENSIEAEIHPDYLKDEVEGRSGNSVVGNDELVHRFYGAVEIDGKIYRVKTTILEKREDGKSKPHDYKVTKVDVILDGGSSTSNAPRTSTIAGAKLLKDVEKSYDSGKKLLDESEKSTFFRKGEASQTPLEADFRRKEEAGRKLAKKLNSDFEAITDIDQIKNKEVRDAIAAGNEVPGWIEIDKDGKKKIFLYLPHVKDTYDAEKTIAHETIGHLGMRELLGEKAYKSYCKSLLYDLKDPELEKYWMENLAKNGFDTYRTIDEFLAEAAEKGYGDLSMWQKVKNAMTDALRSAGFTMSPSISDVKYMVWLSKHNLEKGNIMNQVEREALLYRLGRERYEAKVRNGEYGYGSGDAAAYGEDTAAPYFPGEGKTLFRHTPSVKNQRRNYERALNRLGYAWKEAHVDAMQAAVELMRSISGVKKIEDIPAAENFVLLENQMSSKEEQMDYLLNRDLMEPLDEAVARCLPDMGKGVDEQLKNLQLYMIKKHGLERNRVLFVRDALRDIRNTDKTRADQLEQDYNDFMRDLRDDLHNGNIDLREYHEEVDEWIKNNIDSAYKPGEKDYSGLTSLYGKGYDEMDVIDEVMSTESMLGDERVNDLWDKTNALSKFGLDMEYEGGLDSKEKHDKVSNMFEWYVPLRGYDETTAEEVYDYLEEHGGSDRKWAGPVLMNAEGRESLADVDVFATLGAMSSNAINRSLRNQMKQAFARFIRSHYNDVDADNRLVTELPAVWAEKQFDPMTGQEVWVEKFPDIPENAKADDIAAILDQYQQDMKAKQAAGDAKRVRQSSNIPFRPASKEHKAQHIVDVWINGEKHSFVVNGSPRAAQAINGQLKAERRGNFAYMSSVKNVIAKLATSYNPDFIISNAERDAIFSATAIGIKESPTYLAHWLANYVGRGLGRTAAGVPLMKTNLFNRYRNNELNMANPTDRYFKEFMENGGETGWVESKNIDKWKKLVKENVNTIRSRVTKEDWQSLKNGKLTASDVGRKLVKGGKDIFDLLPHAIEVMNERAENMARFATYMTSRQMGRSITRSVSDAKEVSVNFNRKGAGYKTRDVNKDGNVLQRMNALVAARTAQYGQDYIMFYNAGVQGLNNASKLFRDHPIKASTAFTGFALGAFVMSWLNQSLIDSEDEKERGGIKNPYAELPEYVRRNNACLYIGNGNFLYCALPIELRAMYGIGDMAAGYTEYPDLKSEKPIWQDVTTQLTQVLPIDFMGEHPGNPAINFLPSASRPIAEILTNQNWYGRPIEKENYGNDTKPRHTRAYRSVNKAYMSLAKRWNAATNDYSEEQLRQLGVDEAMISEADANQKGLDGWLTDPSIAQHIVESYLAGLGKTAGNLAHVYRMAKEDDATLGDIVSSDKFPIFRKFHYSPTEQNKQARTRNRWFYYKNQLQEFNTQMNSLKQFGAKDPMAKMKEISEEDSIKATKMKMMADSVKAYNKQKRIHDNPKKDERQKEAAQMRMDQIMQNTVMALDNLQ